MGIMVYSLLWVMQDFVHQQYQAEEMHDQMEASGAGPHGPNGRGTELPGPCCIWGGINGVERGSVGLYRASTV